MTSNAILRGLAVTTHDKIFLGNPFKDPEQIKLAFSRGIESMVVSSIEEIKSIFENSQRNKRQIPELVWQFDASDLSNAKIALLFVKGLGINLAGMKTNLI